MGRGRGMDRRTLLAAGGAAFLLAGCGKDEPKSTPSTKTSGGGTSGKPKKPQRQNRPVASRPPDAKTTKRVRSKPAQASALRHRGPLPEELKAYVAEKVKDSSLVRSKRGAAHHPAICKGHLQVGTSGGFGARSEPTGLHQRYADAIFYSLVRGEADAAKALGVSLAVVAAWPVSVRFADFALAAFKARGTEPTEAAVAAALTAIGAPPARAPAAFRALQDRAERRGR